MYKTALMRRVARETRLSQATVNAVLTASLRQIATALTAGEAVCCPASARFLRAPIALAPSATCGPVG